ncbi:long-chain fatty acid--CoA ligase [Streptomyces sp. NPDC048002]|uniref:acyl-CoA synthetase n=1 Tax=Streptomyces sp. NPDC048002 TaxID=3154344 RepID=UPI0033FEFEDF
MTTPHPTNSGLAVDLNPASAVSRNARYDGEAVVIDYPGGDLTYRQLDDKAARLATVLVRGGARDGDRIAYLGMNSPAFFVTMLAAFRIGALFVPVNFRLADPELAQILESSGAVVIVCEEGHRGSVERVRDRTALRRLLLVDDDPVVPPADADATAAWEPWSPLITAAEPKISVSAKRADDAAILMFTSGTTGTPKGVVLTHGNAWWNSANVDLRLDTRRGDVTYAAAPLFHIGALNSFALRTLTRGGTVAVRRAFAAETCADDLERLKVNSMFGVPQMFAALARVPGFFERDLSSLRAVVVAGAPVPPLLVREYADRGLWLQQAWGLTETAPFATHLPAEDTVHKAGSAGIPMPYTQVRVVDPLSGGPVDVGTPGELVVRGPNVSAGYWNDEEATEAAFDSDGWFHSGDIGYEDGDGYLYVVDRLKDMIVSGGENVYPAEVEKVLAALPGVLESAVVGVPDSRWGETVAAVITVSPGSDITLDAVRDHGAAHLARYKLPRRLTIVQSMPRNGSGKLDKRAIRQIVAGGGTP